MWKMKLLTKNPHEKFQPPQPGFLKLNYDATSKWNLEQSREYAIIRNTQCVICRIYAMDLWFATNNEVEPLVVKHGLKIAV